MDLKIRNIIYLCYQKDLLGVFCGWSMKFRVENSKMLDWKIQLELDYEGFCLLC